MQINPINTNSVEQVKPKHGSINSDGAFQALLGKMLGTGEAELPKAWSDNKFGNGAIENAVKFLSEKCGINAYDRVPSYELTRGDLEWIKNRHSEEEIETLQPFTAAEGNLLADLVFRSIISPEDAKTLQAALIPEHDFGSVSTAEQGGILPKLFPVGAESDYLEKLDMVQEAMESLIDYYSEKEGAASNNSENTAYLQNAKNFTENKQIIKDLLTEIIDSY